MWKPTMPDAHQGRHYISTCPAPPTPMCAWRGDGGGGWARPNVVTPLVGVRCVDRLRSCIIRLIFNQVTNLHPKCPRQLLKRKERGTILRIIINTLHCSRVYISKPGELAPANPLLLCYFLYFQPCHTASFFARLYQLLLLDNTQAD